MAGCQSVNHGISALRAGALTSPGGPSQIPATGAILSDSSRGEPLDGGSPGPVTLTDDEPDECVSCRDQYASELITSPKARLPRAHQVCRLTESLMNLTEPSVKATFTPPEWLLLAAAAPAGPTNWI